LSNPVHLHVLNIVPNSTALPDMAANLRVQEAFDNAKQDFLRDLKDQSLVQKILTTRSVNEVYDETDKLQKSQAERGHLRHLRKIQPYLERLRQFQNVVDTFVQAKAEVLALIWGPIKLLLHATSNVNQSFDAIVNIMAEIGNKLPLFEAYTELFDSSDRVKDVLCLYFKDILDFHLVALNFFSQKRKSVSWSHY
jgi:hypothetical protein